MKVATLSHAAALYFSDRNLFSKDQPTFIATSGEWSGKMLCKNWLFKLKILKVPKSLPRCVKLFNSDNSNLCIYSSYSEDGNSIIRRALGVVVYSTCPQPGDPRQSVTGVCDVFLILIFIYLSIYIYI